MYLKKNILIICIYIILLLLNKNYYWWYPSINTNLLCYGKSYPNYKNEINIMMKEYIFKRTQSDIDFFYLTDNDIIIAFKDVIQENELKKDEMKQIIQSSTIINIIMLYKYIYNRARPSQVAPNIINKINGILLDSKSAATPSYPSGHAFQAYYLARILIKKFPKKKEELIKIADRISNARIIAGLHYPSDKFFAYWLVDNILF